LAIPETKRASRNLKSGATKASSKPSAGTSDLDLSYLEGTIGYAIRRAQIAVFQDIYENFGELSITAVQFSVLAVVHDNPGTNQADLAAALGVERPRMVPILDGLEERKLAVRKADPNDRRHRQLFLTTAGQVLLDELKARFAKHQSGMLSRLNATSAEEFLADLWRLARKS